MNPTPAPATLLRWIGLDLLLGVVGGLVWVALARPAEWHVTEQGINLDEEASKGRFGVIVTFVLIGVIVSFLWGLVAGRSQHHLGWRCVPAFALVATASALIAWQLGVHLGPPDPATVTGVAVGGTIPQELAVDALAPFVVWPIFALVGLLVAACSTRDRGDDRVRHRNEVVGG